ncbi:MAG TPA: sigma-54 dependent transcriptional regulator [Polyangia bacterium]|jgi:DNA-binding NtrC family response regulator|nr:sigma-54 dependent transcriptional regulator [Polyangia bacterium]
MTRVLVAEDDRVARELLCEILRGEGFEVEAVDDGAGAIERAVAGRYDLVVSDVRMERSGGLDVLKAFTERAPSTPVILITAFGDVTGAMEAIQRGAYDYVSKPFNIEELKLTVARALERQRLVAEQKTVPPEARTNLQDIVGKTPVMLEVYKLVARVAASTATVFVHGESGTGKELVARAIHTHSPRAGGAFVPVNCTALTESLLESELFGHAKGAFTGAVASKRGLFEMANGGTLFLDEIGDMGPKMQAQLLRTLQDGEVRPVGGAEAIRVDVRLVCATNKDLEEEVKAGRFREDLYFRINVVTIRLPPLRERREDIPVLVGHFLHKLALRERREPAAMSPEALRLLSGYAFPGNVRELENAIERAVAVAKGNVILPSDLPPEVGGGPEPGAGAETGGILGEVGNRPTLAELERRYIQLVLGEVGGNKKKAAEKLGIDRRTLYRALERSGEPLPDGDDDE